MFAVVLAAGMTYAIVRSERPVVMPPIVSPDPGPAKVVPSGALADIDQQKKLTNDRVDGTRAPIKRGC
jgi:hypothetical protein